MNKYTVTYCLKFCMLCNYYDKIDYDNFEDAQKRLKYLNTLSAEEIVTKEGFKFVPNYLNIQHVSSGL